MLRQLSSLIDLISLIGANKYESILGLDLNLALLSEKHVVLTFASSDENRSFYKA